MNRAPILITIAALAGCSGERLGTASSSRPLAAGHGSLYAASPDDGTVARVDPASREVRKIAAGAEPSRVAISAGRVLVTLRAERSVAVFSPDLVLERKLATGAEPMGIVATADGRRTYVASTLSGTVDELGEDLATLRTWRVEGQPRGLALHPSGRALYVTTTFGGALLAIDLGSGSVHPVSLPAPIVSTGSRVEMTRRITADPAMSPDGSKVAVPMMYADASTPIPDGGDAPPSGGSGYDSTSDGGPRRFNPCVVEVPLDEDGLPDGEPTLTLVSPFLRMPYVSAVAYAEDGGLWVAFEGADAVASYPADHQLRAAGQIAFHPTPSGPDALVPLAGTVFARGFLDRTVGDLAAEQSRWEIAPRTLGDVEERGRRLFYSANDPAITQSGLSCATCHFEGRTDGLTWTFERGPRQTPSLAEDVSGRAPLRWEGDRATIADDAIETSKLMGGGGLGREDAEAIGRFIETVRGVDLPGRGAGDGAVARGKVLFERSDVGCASCHSGALYTDRQLHRVAGSPLKTPSLLGLAATQPYLHDGSIPTLAELVERARNGFMGNTAQLTAAERADLVAFLESL